jgi:uncharacterized protein YjbI with pentapeptide repeats
MVCVWLTFLTSACQADIFRWDNGQLIPGTEGITPGPGVQLDEFELEFAQFSQTNLSEATFQLANLNGADLSGANLTDAWLYGSKLTDANLSGASLAGASLAFARLAGADFDGANVAGVFFAAPTEGGFTKEQLYSTASYQAKDLHGISLWGASTYFFVVNGSILSGWDFSGQNLSGAELGEADLTNANFAGANLTDASFYGATLTSADLTGAIVAGALLGATGLTKEQVYSTASYRDKELPGVQLWGVDLAGGDFSGQNLKNAQIGRDYALDEIDLTGADARGMRPEINLNVFKAHVVSPNVILPDGAVAGLTLAAGDRLLIRDDDGVPDPSPTWWLDPRPPIPVKVFDHLEMEDDGILALRFDADAWDSLISLAPGIRVELGGALDLTFTEDVDVATQVGRTLRIFDWTGVSPFGQFQVTSPYEWDLSKLYTTGEVTLLSANTVPGDYNGNGTVDAADYVLWRDHLGQSVTLPNDATPGTVTQADYEIWKSTFGHVANGATAVATIPEPTTRIPMLIAIASFLARRRAKTSKIRNSLAE